MPDRSSPSGGEAADNNETVYPLHWLLPGGGPAAAAAVLAVTYVVGFMIANFHFAAYEPLRLDLLQARYVGAGLAFFAVAAVPAYAAAHAGYLSAHAVNATRRKPRQASPKVRELLLSVLFLVVVTVFFEFVVFEIIWSPGLYGWEFEIARAQVGVARLVTYFPTVVAVFSYLLSAVTTLNPLRLQWRRSPTVRSSTIIRLHGSESLDSPSAEPQATLDVLLIALLVLSTLVILMLFARMVYPFVTPALGGGAGWYADVTVVLKPSSDSETLDRALRRSVVLVDRDEHITNLLICPSGPGEAHSLTLPSDQVVAVRLIGLAALPRAKRRMCRHVTQGPMPGRP